MDLQVTPAEMSKFELLESNLKAVTDRLTELDKIFAAEKQGVEKVMCFQCNHSGLYYPMDYVKQWGRSYGHGLGPDPVSEVLDTDYFTAPPPITPEIRTIEQIMHPLGYTRVQVDLHTVPKAEYEASLAVLAKDDPYLEKRVKIIRPKQLQNPLGRLRNMQAAWERAGR